MHASVARTSSSSPSARGALLQPPKPLISDVRPLAQARESVALLEGGDVFGKLVLTT